MASITLKNVPDDLLQILRGAAANDRRSLNQEIIHLLDSALRERVGPTPPPAHVKAQLAAWRRLAGKWESEVTSKAEERRLLKRRTLGREVDL